MKKLLLPMVLLAMSLSFSAYALETLKPNDLVEVSFQQNKPSKSKLCKDYAGKIITMQAVFSNGGDNVEYGLVHDFCKIIDKKGNNAYIGLENLGKEPTIVDSYLLKLDLTDKSLPQDPYKNPSSNLCLSLGGTEAVFNTKYSSQGFQDTEGQSNICVFGDGSFISSWTLIYAASGQRPDIINMISDKRITRPSLNVVIPNF